MPGWRYRWDGRIDMQAVECGQRARKIRRIAGNILDLRAIQKTDGGDRECRNSAVVQSDGIFECQDVSARSASIGGRSAIVECSVGVPVTVTGSLSVSE